MQRLQSESGQRALTGLSTNSRRIVVALASSGRIGFNSTNRTSSSKPFGRSWSHRAPVSRMCAVAQPLTRAESSG